LKKLFGTILAFSVTIAASVASAAGGSTISGTLRAPANASVKGSVVIACAPTKDGCDEKASRLTEVKTAGPSAPFKVEGLAPGNYTLIGWRDTDGDDEVSDGDLLGVYSKDGKNETPVRPPAENVSIEMSVYRDEASAATAPASASTSSPAAPTSTNASTKAAPYTVTGVVKDEAGKPLAGVEVFADNTLYYNMNALATTDAQGRYTIKLPRNEVGTWKAGAYIEREYEGVNHRFRLYADSEAAFATDEGAVRNFVWKLSGKAPGGGVIGALVYVYGSYDGAGFDLQKVELTLTPVGPLVDGNPGKPITRVVQGGQINDVPVGRYTVTARYRPDGGAPVPMLVQAKGGSTYGPSATDSFKNSFYGTTMEFFVKLP
jgi:uncharacterized protein (DUF2141 family)